MMIMLKMSINTQHKVHFNGLFDITLPIKLQTQLNARNLLTLFVFHNFFLFFFFVLSRRLTYCCFHLRMRLLTIDKMISYLLISVMFGWLQERKKGNHFCLNKILVLKLDALWYFRKKWIKRNAFSSGLHNYHLHLTFKIVLFGSQRIF